MPDLFWINRASLKQAAIAYAMKGWPVLPLNPREKRPLVDPDLQLFNGLKQASDDIAKVEEWWDKHPTANIGLLTGVVFDALDLDGPLAKIAMVRLAPKYRHDGPVQSTGKGQHLLFSASGSKNHAGLADAPIDYRGTAGYIVASPSVHPNGHKYVWARDGQLPAVPDWLSPLIFPPKKERTTDPNDPKMKEDLDNAGDLVGIFELIVGGVEHVGQLYRTFCPFHEDDTASLYIYPQTNTFTCFGCHAWGDPLNVKRWMNTGRLRRDDKIRISPLIEFKGKNFGSTD